MEIQLRPYQQEIKDRVFRIWQEMEQACIYAIAPTGSGKTVLFSAIIQASACPTLAIAHRSELVMQMSVTLAKFKIPHTILSSAKKSSATTKNIIKAHILATGRSYYDPNSDVSVASVQTICANQAGFASFLSRVKLCIVDEAHHMLRDNIWGKAVTMCPRARILGVTATPCRTDGKALGAAWEGLADHMIVGPTMRDLINQGHLSDYEIYCCQSNIDMTDFKLTAKGDWSPKALAEASDRSQIVGDVVGHYLRIAPGKKGVTFVADMKTAHSVCEAYNDAGVPAMVINAKTPSLDRLSINQKFEKGELLQIVNVDILGEGYDCPALEVVSFARPTKSYGLYVQQFGRVLRTFEGKTVGIIIDHVNNVIEHGLPDAPKNWTLERKPKRKSKAKDDIQLKVCEECFRPYEKIEPVCPYCGAEPKVSERDGPEEVDGDLTRLSPEVLAQMRGEILQTQKTLAQVISECEAKYMPAIGVAAAVNRQRKLLEAHRHLKEMINQYGKNHLRKGISQDKSYKLFKRDFGIDVMTAQTIGTKEAIALSNKILLIKRR